MRRLFDRLVLAVLLGMLVASILSLGVRCSHAQDAAMFFDNGNRPVVVAVGDTLVEAIEIDMPGLGADLSVVRASLVVDLAALDPIDARPGADAPPGGDVIVSGPCCGTPPTFVATWFSGLGVRELWEGQALDVVFVVRAPGVHVVELWGTSCTDGSQLTTANPSAYYAPVDSPLCHRLYLYGSLVVEAVDDVTLPVERRTWGGVKAVMR